MTLEPVQEELRGVVRAFALKHSETGHLREALETGYSRETWTQLSSQMGLTGIAVEERFGGAGGSTVDIVVALEELGRMLVPSPLFATVALALPVLREADDEEAFTRWLSEIANGERTATAAHREGDVIATNGPKVGWRLKGTVDQVMSGATADLLLVRARTVTGNQIFGVDTAHTQIVREPLPVLDFTRPMATVHLRDVPAQLIRCEDADKAFKRALKTTTVMLAAEQVGGAQGCLDLAVQHVKTRFQFGRPIGAFQVIKHICADMFTEIACARSLTYDAAREEEGGRTVNAEMASAAAGEAFVRVAEQSIQVHGALGYTWESDCHLYLRRARSSMQLLNSPRIVYDSIADELVGAITETMQP